MRAIIDASVALKAVLVEPDSDKARLFLDDFHVGIHSLLAPDIFRVEVGHALTRAERKRIIPVGHAVVHFDDLMAPPPELHDCGPLMAKAVELSSQSRTSVYDCLYLCLAFEQNCEVVTADRRFLTAFASTGKVIDLSHV